MQHVTSTHMTSTHCITEALRLRLSLPRRSGGAAGSVIKVLYYTKYNADTQFVLFAVAVKTQCP
jgi:hypothetical protein